MRELQIKTALQISRSPQEVFEAVVDPKQMSNYFISESSGRMEEGRTLEWKFPEFEDSAEIKVVELIPQEYVSFLWEGAKNKKLLVEMTFLEMPNESTLLRITEGKMEDDEAGLKWLGQNTEGWANFLACLKAYLEYGVNLRKGAFDFMREN
ncbi:SRPBCC domain-containing protein [Salinimicrobium sp. GXAS 041]|uniref:SRPBCC domain-containing protein n=1 Tax=Salinimicrobium sp. GXAS 041 TaxID=3400806 RepID=UPI003C74E444